MFQAKSATSYGERMMHGVYKEKVRKGTSDFVKTVKIHNTFGRKNDPQVCHRCFGRGWIHVVTQADADECPACGGTGEE